MAKPRKYGMVASYVPNNRTEKKRRKDSKYTSNKSRKNCKFS